VRETFARASFPSGSRATFVAAEPRARARHPLSAAGSDTDEVTSGDDRDGGRLADGP
jgi:hypothetical protein